MKIAVVGSLNMDMTVTSPRIPHKGETILGGTLSFFPGGKGANQAYALGRLGAQVAMYGCFGQDDFGSQLTDNLARAGVDARWVMRLPDVKTGVALITIAENDNTIVVVPGANAQVSLDYIDSVADQLRQSDLVMMQLEIPLDTVAYVTDLCAKAGVPVLLNPAPARPLPPHLLEQVRYLTPNEHEAALLFHHQGPLDDLLITWRGKLVVTLGENGSAMADEDGRIICTPASPAQVVDTTGAGDTFNAALALALIRGDEPETALRFANAAAALSTEKMGAQAGMPTLDEVRKRMGD